LRTFFEYVSEIVNQRAAVEGAAIAGRIDQVVTTRRREAREVINMIARDYRIYLISMKSNNNAVLSNE
jgi:hypothetical protein